MQSSSHHAQCGILTEVKTLVEPPTDWPAEVFELNKALRRYKKYRTSQLEEVAKNTYFQRVRQDKRAHWDNFLQNAIKEDIFKAYRYKNLPKHLHP